MTPRQHLGLIAFALSATLYFPDQNYPTQGFGGWLERLGDWAYVHE